MPTPTPTFQPSRTFEKKGKESRLNGGEGRGSDRLGVIATGEEKGSPEPESRSSILPGQGLGERFAAAAAAIPSSVPWLCVPLSYYPACVALRGGARYGDRDLVLLRPCGICCIAVVSARRWSVGVPERLCLSCLSGGEGITALLAALLVAQAVLCCGVRAEAYQATGSFYNARLAGRADAKPRLTY